MVGGDDDVDEAEDVSTLPDNLSDFVPISANVSGRGSPSLSGGRGSGRGTPFSGGGGPTDNATSTMSVSSTMADAAGASRAEAHRNLPKLPVTVRKQNPEGLEEKFGKFGLPPTDTARYRNATDIDFPMLNKVLFVGDETYSYVSDSWSTDVVASDNEGLSEQSMQMSSALSAGGSSSGGGGGLATAASAPAVAMSAAPPLPPRPNYATPPSPMLAAPGHVVSAANNTSGNATSTPPLPNLHESLSAGRLPELAATSASGGGGGGGSSASTAAAAVGSLTSAERERIADDILNKYREMRPLPPPLPLLAPYAIPNGLRPELTATAGVSATTTAIAKSEEPLIAYYDPANITQCRAFVDAKRKLRLVLSSAANIPTNAARPATADDYARASNGSGAGGGGERGGRGVASMDDDSGGGGGNNGGAPDDARTNLIEFLKLLLAESINSQDKTLSAQIREVQRCLAIFDQRGVRKLLRTLRDEHRRRTSYQMYLQQSRLTLLHLHSYVLAMVYLT